MTVYELNKVFGRNLRYFRMKKGWSRPMLSKESGISKNTISEYEQGRMFASANAQLILASLLGIEIWQLYVIDKTDKKPALLNEITTQGIKKQVGVNIRYYRKKNGLRQYEIAEKLGVSHSVVSNHEVCLHFPTLDELVKYANIFGIEVSQLFSNKEEEHRSLIQGVKNDKCA